MVRNLSAFGSGPTGVIECQGLLAPPSAPDYGEGRSRGRVGSDGVASRSALSRMAQAVFDPRVHRETDSAPCRRKDGGSENRRPGWALGERGAASAPTESEQRTGIP
eukprot:4954754-Pleurochrysis_carterae.AAC.1